MAPSWRRRGAGCRFEGECQTVCKPGSVPAPRGAGDDHSSGMPVARHLTRPTRTAIRKQTAAPEDAACRPYLVLLQVGFAVPAALPRLRWALTPPFHPCRGPKPGWRYAFCCTVPGVAPAGRYPAPLFPWSPDFPRRLAPPRPSDRLAPPRCADPAGPSTSGLAARAIDAGEIGADQRGDIARSRHALMTGTAIGK